MSRHFLRLVGLVLCLAAIPKLRNPVTFYAALKGYQLFPWWSLEPLSFGIPSLELVVGLSLLLRLSLGGHFWATLLFGGFSLVLTWGRLHGLSLTCGCFGRFDHWLHGLPYGLALHIALNLSLTVALTYLLLRRIGRRGSQGAVSRIRE